MINSPQADFRAELGSLRDQVIRSIQEGIPSNIESGLAIYRRVLERLLSRFADIEKRSGRRPQYELLSFGESSGQELGWLQSDYSDFLSQALRTRDPLVLQSIARGLQDLVTSSGRLGDLGAFRVFLALIPNLWGQAEIVFEGQQDWVTLRSVLLLYLNNLPAFILQSGFPRLPISINSRVGMLVLVAKCFSDVMKLAVDNSALADLEASVEQFEDSFREDWIDIVLDNSLLAEADQRFVRRTVISYTNSAALGIQGWILYRWDKRELDSTLMTSMRSIMQKAIYRPWSAFSLVQDFEGRNVFGWSFWETMRPGRRQSPLVQIDGYVRESLLLAAIDTGQIPRLQDFVGDESGRKSIRDVRFIAQQLRSLVVELQTLDKWEPLSINQVSATEIGEALSRIEEQAAGQLVDELIREPLSGRLVQKFHDIAIQTWREQPKVLALFSCVEIVGEGSAEQPGEAQTRWRRFGVYRPEPKDFFIESDDVYADTAMLASQYVRAQIQSEAAYLLERITDAHPKIRTWLQTVADMVEERVGVLKKQGHSPQILVFGSWTVLEALRTVDPKLGPAPGIGPVGTFKGSQVFWETGTGATRCVVLDPVVAGRVAWRRPKLELGDRPAEGGRFVSSVRFIDEEMARELLETNPGILGETSQLVDDGIRALQQTVLVRVQEILYWEELDPSACIVIEVDPRPEDELK